MTENEAVELGKTRWWETMSAKNVALFQLQQDRLCLPLEEYRKALLEALGRMPFSHEIFGGQKALIQEIKGEIPSPTEEEILKGFFNRFSNGIVFVQ